MARAKNGSGPIRVAIAGLGRAGWGMHCGELDRRADKFQIVAACDIEPSRCQRMAERYPHCTTYGDITHLLQDESVELVSIATRSPDHVPHALAALKAGKYVFVEKPIAVTLQGAMKLKAAAAKYRGRLFVRHNRRFETEFVHIREVIDSSVLGKVFQVKLRRNSYSRRDDWQTLKGCGGGQLLNWGPHIIDHALRLLDSPLSNIWSNLGLVAALGDAEDHLKIILTGRSGRVVDLEISGGAALAGPEWTVYGSKGALTCSGNTVTARYIDPAMKFKTRRSSPGTPGMDGAFHQVGPDETPRWIEKTYPAAAPVSTDSIWDALYATIRQGKKFPITIDQAVEVMKVVSAVKKGTAFDTLPKYRGC
ncbi:MAG: Gfo/Idh/MocA family oxidoreductase [Planctomycetaceae bacterium]|nr:Gfo/Idh/MocA family oxidoreductase [Planctomycetaceae bacterium]